VKFTEFPRVFAIINTTLFLRLAVSLTRMRP